MGDSRIMAQGVGSMVGLWLGEWDLRGWMGRAALISSNNSRHSSTTALECEIVGLRHRRSLVSGVVGVQGLGIKGVRGLRYLVIQLRG